MKKVTEDMFHLVVGQHKITEEAVVAGKYDYVNGDVNSQNFPYRNRPNGNREIVLLEFDYDSNSDQVIAEAEKQGLTRPDYEDALDFGEQFPTKQREFTIVFLHEPWRASNGDNFVLVLNSDSLGRNLLVSDFYGGWGCKVKFPFVRN